MSYPQHKKQLEGSAGRCKAHAEGGINRKQNGTVRHIVSCILVAAILLILVPFALADDVIDATGTYQYVAYNVGGKSYHTGMILLDEPISVTVPADGFMSETDTIVTAKRLQCAGDNKWDGKRVHVYSKIFHLPTTQHDVGDIILDDAKTSLVESAPSGTDNSTMNSAGQKKGISVYLNGMELSFDQPPVIKNSRTFVPIRAVAEGFGAQVKWDGDARQITIKNGSSETLLYVDSVYCYLNGTAFMTDAKPFIVNGRTMVPVRLVSQVLGCRVQWDGDTQSVLVTKVASNDEELQSGLNQFSQHAAFNEVVRVFQETKEMYGAVDQCVRCGKFVSVLISAQYDGGDNLYKTYLFDTEKDSVLSPKEFIQACGLNETEFVKAVYSQCDRVFDAANPKQEALQYVSEKFYQQQRMNTQTKRCYSIDSPLYLDDAGNIYAVVQMPGISGGDYDYAIDTGFSVP